jgi:hypothetical protein
MASSSGRSPFSGFPNCPQPQLWASHSNSSQGLNCSSPLTHSPTKSLHSTALTELSSQSQAHIATDCQSLSLRVEPHLGLMTGYFLLFDSYGLVFVGRPLLWEDRSVFCTCCWPLPGQSFSGLSPLVLATIFYCRLVEWYSCGTDHIENTAA